MDELHGKLPLRLQTLETAIVFVTQWCRPNFDVFWKDVIPNKFDKLAEKVKKHLKVVHPNHPLFAVPAEDLKIWREEDIDGNKYDAEDCEKVLQALESVLAFTTKPDDSMCIHKANVILKELVGTDLMTVYGRYTSMLLTFQCVARRLGLKYTIISPHFNQGLVLRASSNFSMSQRADLPIARREQFDPIIAVHHYGNSHPRRCPGPQFLELLEALSPLDVSPRTFMKECYLDQTVYSSLLNQRVIEEGIKDPHSLKPEMMKILQERRGFKIMVKENRKVRPPNLKYAVGMIMKYVELPLKCIIYDWDPVCFSTDERQQRDNINSLEFKHNQPFYSVFNENGSIHYIAQERLEPSTHTGFFLHLMGDIGRHFSHEFETHFVPNEEKKREYPEDAAVRRRFHQKFKSEFSQ